MLQDRSTLLFVAAVAVLAVSGYVAEAFEAADCSEVPECLNEYQWKHKATQAESVKFCKDRYKSCKNIDGSDLPAYCKVAKKDCVLFLYGYFKYTNQGKAKATKFCTERLPRC